MTAQTPVLRSAAELARLDPVHFPDESAEYRAARAALLAEEIELRRHIERVAAQRRTLPPGGAVIGDYRFEGENGPVDFAGLFGDKETLAAIAAGRHLSTLAFSETGSRSHFWAPLGTATAEPDGTVRLDASKSWVTSAGHADSYVWSSLPLDASITTTSPGSASPAS